MGCSGNAEGDDSGTQDGSGGTGVWEGSAGSGGAGITAGSGGSSSVAGIGGAGAFGGSGGSGETAGSGEGGTTGGSSGAGVTAGSGGAGGSSSSGTCQGSVMFELEIQSASPRDYCTNACGAWFSLQEIDAASYRDPCGVRSCDTCELGPCPSVWCGDLPLSSSSLSAAWSGEHFVSATCGEDLVCTTGECAPPGRYTVAMCVTENLNRFWGTTNDCTRVGEVVCTEVEFDWPMTGVVKGTINGPAACEGTSSALHSSPCTEIGAVCIADPGCCRCIDTPDCGSFWECASLGFEDENCPGLPPIAGSACYDSGLVCGYCRERFEPQTHTCNSDGWRRLDLEIECP